jgi:elongator complex protein 3
MPGLPGSSSERDLGTFRKIFTDSNFKPDMMKVYPCLVLKGTKIYDWYQERTFRPYTNEEAADLIAEVKKIVPPWMRIMRVQRDIPAKLIVAGVNKSNLRQLVQQKLAENGIKCRCIRCREIGHAVRDGEGDPSWENVSISTARYEVSEGEELFISAEDNKRDILIGYLRLRIPSKNAHRNEVKAQRCSIIRELHVYGSLVPVGKRLSTAWQHKGYGALLLAEAERTTHEDYGLNRILVLSALGTKQYYRRFGYDEEGVYMSKTLENQK